MTQPAEPARSSRTDPGRDTELDEEIDEASDESFPASDAPQWWSGPHKSRGTG